MRTLYVGEMFVDLFGGAGRGQIDASDRTQRLSRDILKALSHSLFQDCQSLSNAVLERAFGFDLKFCERAIL
jgi:hypothetical protein